MISVAICGGPLVGKHALATLLAHQRGWEIISTGDFQNVPWDRIPNEILRVLRARSGFILEGVQAARVIRRALNEGNTLGLEAVYWLEKPIGMRTPQQETLAKGVATVFESARPVLQARGVPILPGLPPQLKHLELKPPPEQAHAAPSRGRP